MTHTWLIRRLLLLIILLWVGLPTMLARDFIVVIDPGHGGTAPGTIEPYNSRNPRVKEKDIVLPVSLELGKRLEKVKGIKVGYTRKTDITVSGSRRAKIANDANADLFISIHVNSLKPENPERKSMSGALTLVWGNSDSKNKVLTDLENEDFYLEGEQLDSNSPESMIMNDFRQGKYLEQSIDFGNMVQRELKTVAGRKDRGVVRDNILVLNATAMPAVLIELDFLCNPTQEKFLTSKSGQEKMVQAIYNATLEYKAEFDKRQDVKMVSDGEETPDGTLTAAEAVDEAQVTYYKIQFMAVPKELAPGSREFKGLDPVEYYREGKFYKYTYGKSTNRNDLKKELKQVQKLFKDAFIVAIRDGKRVK